MLTEEAELIIKQIKYYAEALLTATSNSNLLHLTEQDANVLIIDQNAEELEKMLLHENAFGAANMQKLQKIYDKQRLIYADKGISNLFLFKKVLQTNENDIKKNLSAPIFLLPCTLNKIKGFQQGYEVKCLADKWITNPLLRKNFKDRYQVILTEEIDPLDEYDITNNLHQVGIIQEVWGIGLFPLRDYAIYNDIQSIVSPNHSLEVFFGNEPKPILPNILQRPFYDYRLITDCDSSQLNAIEVCEQQPHMRIEGPPGTGKSQTITNLIAQALHRKEKVLVVSDKKVALDVLEQKMNVAGLKHLLTMIHDVYLDKVDFYETLKSAYQACLSYTIQRRDESLKAQYVLHQKLVDNYHKAALEVWPKIGINYDALREIETIATKLELNFVKPLEWEADKPYVVALLDLLFSEFNLHSIQDSVIGKINIEHFNTDSFKEVNLKEIIQLLQALKSGFPNIKSVTSLNMLCKKALLFKVFLDKNTMFLFDKKATKVRKILKLTAKRERLENKLEALFPKTDNTKIPFSAIEVESMMQVVEMYEATKDVLWEKSYFEIKEQIEKYINGNAYRIKPTVKSIVKQLGKYELLAQEKITIEREIAEMCHADNYDTEVFQMYYILAKADQGDKEINEIIEGKYTSEYLMKCIEWKEKVANTAQKLQLIFSEEMGSSNFEAQIDCLSELSVNQKLLEKASYCLQFLKETASHRWEIYQRLSLDKLPQFEQEIFKQAKLFIEYHQPILKNTQEADLAISKEIIRSLKPLVYEQNAKDLEAMYQQNVFDYFSYFAQPMSEYKGSEKEEKKRVNLTRKMMEQEFAKKQKHISIRRFMSETDHELLFKIKPVWLMSPSSVPALFAPDQDIFDVVIIDESSRVKLPHSISALYRAKRAIVVGDEKQMPPAHFFEAKQGGSDEEPDYESILHKAVERLPGVMLTHHYRSKRKDLIEFSNRFMYHHQLKIMAENSGGLHYQFVEQGRFESGKNKLEAEALADFLEDKTGSWNKFSIGVLAFSKEQADLIQDVLKARRKNNKALDEFLNHQEEKEAGFFIKNLENVQGDERDIVILSIGYGYNAEGKFRQQFGPLNQEGGERRLNVLITRAKEYMYVFTSVHHYDITLEERLGVTMLKQFLKFAETGV
jgi:hypothetical protein